MANKKRLTGPGYFMEATWQDLKPDLDMFLRRHDRLQELCRITDSSKLPEYLTDEDPLVVEAAKRKLDELTGE